MHGSIHRTADTPAIVNGGSYIWEHDDGTVVEGLIMGVTRTPKVDGTILVEGSLYIHSRGPIPIQVVEGTESFEGWQLVAAPAKSAADYINGRTKKKKKEEAA